MTFKLDDNFIKSYVGKQPKWGPVGEITYRRTYARPIDSISERHAGLAGQHGLTDSEDWWLTVARVVEGTYEIQRRHCLSNKLRWNAEKAQSSAQEMFRLIFNFKFTPPGRGLWMMGAPIVDKIGGAALNNCFSGDTEFWADGKLQKFKDCVNKSVMVTTYSGQREAKVKSYGNQRLNEIVLKYPGRSNFRISYRATANHRWILANQQETTSLRVGDRIRVVPRWGGGTGDWNVGFAHGLIFGDGTKHTYYPERHFIRLCGDKIKFSRCLENLDGYVSTRAVRGSDDVIVTIIRQGEDWKKVPIDEKSLDYKNGFLQGWLAADGSSKNSTTQLCSINHDALDWVIKHSGEIGYCVTGDNTDCTTVTNFGSRTRLLRRITLTRQPVEYVVESITPTIGEAEVFCVEEPVTKTFMLSGGVVTGNCAFVSTKNIDKDFTSPFTFLMDMSMLGVGVGFDTLGAGKFVIGRPWANEKSGKFVQVIEDTREGWVKTLETVLCAYAGKDYLPEFDYSRIRPAGSPIKGFGGVAAGPEPLKLMVERLCKLFDGRFGEDLTSTDIVDIMNIIGVCVVSGNVRRSAELSIGNPNDEKFLSLKDYRSYPEECTNWRWASNNSVAATLGMDYSRVAEGTALNGEPGYIWLENARSHGRMGSGETRPDSLAMGVNPCSEQTLEDKELCCLAEVYPSLHDSYDELQNTLKYVYLYTKTVTLVPTHNEDTNQVMLRNRRIGVSLTGVVQAMEKHGRRRVLDWADQGYTHLRSRDKQYSRWLCIPESIKITSVKPSGTVSLLPGVTPGIHFPHSEYYFRVIRFASNSVFLEKYRKAGYRVVDDLPGENNTSAIYFPIKEEFFRRSKNQVTLWEQLELAAQMQTYWSDNQVSVTVTFSREEAKDITYALELYETRLKSVSFLPRDDHNYSHAPYQEISEREYSEYCSKLLPVDLSNSSHEKTDSYCDGDKCELPGRIN